MKMKSFWMKKVLCEENSAEIGLTVTEVINHSWIQITLRYTKLVRLILIKNFFFLWNSGSLTKGWLSIDCDVACFIFERSSLLLKFSHFLPNGGWIWTHNLRVMWRMFYQCATHAVFQSLSYSLKCLITYYAGKPNYLINKRKSFKNV